MVKFVDPINKINLKKKKNYFYNPKTFKKYKIINNIPRFVTFENTNNKMWGYQWNKYQLTQFDSHTGLSLSQDRLQSILGKKINFLKKQNILEVGSGAGGFTEIILKNKKINLFTVDFSKAIDSNKKNNQHLSKKTKFIQADANNLPFTNEKFDLVICIGVIQHTPSSEQTINNLWKMVKPGGKLIIDHYELHWRYYLSTVPLFRFFLKDKNPNFTIKFCRNFVNIFFPIFWKIKKFKIITKLIKKIIPLGLDPSGLRNNMGYEKLKEFTYLDTHDMLCDPIKNLLTKKKFLYILKNLNNKKIEFFESGRKGGNGLEARLKKIL